MDSRRSAGALLALIWSATPFYWPINTLTPKDSTLIQTRDGHRFARDANDWRWWHAVVPGRLKGLHEEG